MDYRFAGDGKTEITCEDEKARKEFMEIKYQNKVRLAKYILEHNGIEVDPTPSLMFR